MPKFELNKLVRGNLKHEYKESNQTPVYCELSTSDLKKELIRKIIEESLEINFDDSERQITDEFADILQAYSDLAVLCNISQDQIESARQEKFDKKGGFAEGIFVETIELADNDKWVEYYRQNPEIFKEIK